MFNRRNISSAAILTLFAPMLWAQAYNYTFSTAAGTPVPLLPAPAVSIPLGDGPAVSSDGAGNSYIVSSPASAVYKVSPDGTASLFAGTGLPGYSGDGGPAINATLFRPSATAVDSSGNVFIADSGNRAIREVTLSTGIITTVVSNITIVVALAVSPNGTLYFADRSIVQMISNGIVTTFAGNGTSGYSGDGGPAIAAELNEPVAVALDPAGNVYIADSGNSAVRKVSTTGVITTFAGNGGFGYTGDGGPATLATLSSPGGVATDVSGNLYICDVVNNVVRKVTANGLISTFAGDGKMGFSGDGGPATSATFSYPETLATGPNGAVYVADAFNSRVRLIASSGLITTVAGNGTLSYYGDGGPAAGAMFSNPQALAVGTDGTVYVADTGNYRVRKVAGGVVTTIAGNGIAGDSGDGGPAADAEVDPLGIALDSSGNLYIADGVASRIRKISVDGMISSVAGNGIFGYSGDGGPATSAELAPYAIAVNGAGNLFIADYQNCVVRKVSTSGEITTIAGDGTAGYSGDNGPATSAQLSYPTAVAVDGSGNVYIAQFTVEQNDTNEIRKVSPSGIITTVSSGGSVGGGVAVDASGDLFTSSASPVSEQTPTGAVYSIAVSSTDIVTALTVGPNGTVYYVDSPIGVIQALTPCIPSFTSPAAADSSTQTISLPLAVGSACSWSASNLPSWITYTSSGTGPGTLALSTQANTTGADRSATINVSGTSLTVTQAFTTQTFTDVTPSAYYFDATNLLAGKSITAGCGATTYCPNAAVTRDDMAIFIVRTILGTGAFTYSPTPHFEDVPTTNFAFPWIQKLYELGVTTGCSVAPLNYCPGVTVTRDQMSIYLIRARYGATTPFTSNATPYFSDVSSDYYAFDWIQRLYQDGITAGCSLSPLDYCPDSPVFRGDMAIFLMRGGFNQLIPSTQPVIVSISPVSLPHGTTGTFTITGANTAFQQGVTSLVFPPNSGVTVDSITVTSATSMQVQLTASSSATLQPVSIYEQTEPQESVLPNGLLVN